MLIWHDDIQNTGVEHQMVISSRPRIGLNIVLLSDLDYANNSATPNNVLP